MSYSAPRRGPTRQQRAALISEEVKMIQRDHPAPTFSEPDPDTLRPPGAGQTVDPEMVGKNVAPGRMGANDKPTREGPTAQGVGRVVNASEDVVADTTKMARGVRSPHDTVTEPTKGGPSVLDVTAGSRRSHTLPAAAHKAQSAAPSTSAAARFRQDVASGKYSTSTIAGSRFDHFITDQVKQVRRRVEDSPANSKSRNQKLSRSVLRSTVAGRYYTRHRLLGTASSQTAMREIAKATEMNGTYMVKDSKQFLRKVRSLLPEADSTRAAQQQSNIRKDASISM